MPITVGPNTVSGRAFTAYINVAPAQQPILIGGLVRGEIENSADDLDGTDSNSSPYQLSDAGTVGCRITLEGHFRLNSNVMNVLQAGTYLTGLYIWPHGVVAPTFAEPSAWRFPSAVVISANQPTEIRGKVTMTFRVASRGIFYTPGMAGG